MTCICGDGCIKRCPGIALDEFREILCVNPYYFWQFAQLRTVYPMTDIPQYDTGCNPVVYERCTGGCNVAGRNEVLSAILSAEQAFRDQAGYWPSLQPDYDEHYFPRGFRGGRIQLRSSKVKQLGRLKLESIQIEALEDVAIQDTDGDGLPDSVALTIAPIAGMSIDELAVFFVDGDQAFDDCRNEIRPITAKESNGQWVLTWPAWLSVKPRVYRDWRQPILDPLDPTLYPTHVHLFRRWVDPSEAVVIMRKPVQCGCDRTGECYVAECADACILSHEEGIVEINLPAGCGCCNQCFDRLCVHYVSGECDSPELRLLLARLAAAYIGRDICCGEMSGEVGYWQADYVGVSDRGRTVTTLTDAERASAFGTRRGGIEMYRYLRRPGKKKMRIGIL